MATKSASISMCLIWTVKYNICGCICERESIYCASHQYCWGPRAIIFHSNLQTCAECWKNGDKRVNKRLAKILDRFADENQERNRQRDERSRSRQRTDRSPGRNDADGARARCEDVYGGEKRDLNINMTMIQPEEFRHEDAEISGRNEDRESQSYSNPSRPNTPVRDIILDPDCIPPWLLSIEQNCDVTRVFDPVRTSSISGHYRAPRRSIDWYALEGKCFTFPLHSLNCWLKC